MVRAGGGGGGVEDRQRERERERERERILVSDNGQAANSLPVISGSRTGPTPKQLKLRLPPRPQMHQASVQLSAVPRFLSSCKRSDRWSP